MIFLTFIVWKHKGFREEIQRGKHFSMSVYFIFLSMRKRDSDCKMFLHEYFPPNQTSFKEKPFGKY